MIQHSVVNDTTILLLLPNCSAHWPQAKLTIVLLSIPVSMIAVLWGLAGAWFVLPFAGIELGLFAWLMYRVNGAAHHGQLLTITQSSIQLSQGRYQGSKTPMVVTFARKGCVFTFTQTERHWQLPICALHCDGQHYQLGSFLNLQDRKQLVSYLADCGLAICRNRWWEQ